MRWYHYVAYFFGAMFLTNALPHLVAGISGRPMQSPFASPPGQGLSSSTVNVWWGFFNLAMGYLLIARIGTFEIRRTRHVLILGLGVLVMSIMLARASSASKISTRFGWRRFSPRRPSRRNRSGDSASSAFPRRRSFSAHIFPKFRSHTLYTTP